MSRRILMVLLVVLASSTTAHAQSITGALSHVVSLDRFRPEWLSSDSDRFPLQPARRRARMPRHCRTQGGYRAYCQGPREVPVPTGPAAELARTLGLGLRATAMHAMHSRPFEEWMEVVRGLDSNPDLSFPVPAGHMGRGFGYTRDEGLRSRRHDGVDIGGELGTAIVAARDGLVLYSDNGVTGMGNVVILLHQDGASTLYAHCRATHVFAGQVVRRGEQIGEVGQTGFANAPHVHFEYRQRGWLRDPVRLLRWPERR
jgi:murein DD-endopeptidase MepM/ murein hydrolase activator NlpD